MKKVIFTLFFSLIIAIAAKSQTMPTIRQVYDFNVNDEFHRSSTLTSPNAARIKIIGKYFSANNDTVFYVQQHNNYTSSINWFPTPHLDYTFTFWNDTVYYTNLDTLINSQYKYMLNDSCNSSTDTVYYTSQYCGDTVYQHNSCSNCCFEGVSYVQIYGIGLGLVSHDYEYPAIGAHYHSDLFYYKKGTIVCGNADTTMESINKIEFSIPISLSPNPFTTTTQITLDKTYHHISLSVYDIQGKLMLQKQYADCSQIQLNRNGLNNGMYFLKLTLDEKWVETGKILISE